MRRKSVLSACVALALSGQGWAADISEIDNSDDSHKSLKVICSVNPEKRSKEEQQKLPPECLQQTNRTLSPWLAFGGTAAITALVVAEVMNNDGHHHHHSTDAVPPDDNVIPPDDGDDDNVIPPDDGGDDNPIPPDDGGDVTPPDDGGDNTPIPPDDGGDVTPPAPVVYKNNVTWDQANNTLKIRDAIFSYSQNADGTYTLTAPDGRTTVVNAWEVDNANNTIQIDGINTAGNIDWRYDDDGNLYITKKAALVADDAADTVKINAHDVVITDQGGNTALNGATAMTITGNNIVINNDGDTVATGDGSVVGVLTGDNITINNNGSITVDGGTAAIVNGDHATINNTGDSTVTNGGTSAHITGDNATVDNIGTMTVDGANSTGILIDGNEATVKQDGDLYVSVGAHGINVAGNGTIVSNKGNITVVDENSIGVMLDGDKTTFMNIGDIKIGDTGHDGNPSGVLIGGDNATFLNVGDIAASNIGTGVKITGDASRISLAGGMTVDDSATGLGVAGNHNNITLATYELKVDGENATGVNVTGDGNNVEIAGDMIVAGENAAGVNASGNDTVVDLKGDLNISGGASGIAISGDRSNLSNKGKITVTDHDSVGILIDGDDGKFSNIGEIDVTMDGSGAVISGDRQKVNLSGDINISQESDSDGNVRGATGISVAGNDSSVVIDGNVNISSSRGDHPGTAETRLDGITITGENNTVNLNGQINISVESGYTGNKSNIAGLAVSGTDNTINLDGGINISGDSGGHLISGVSVTGDNTVNISGHSTMDSRQVNGSFSLVSVKESGKVIFEEDSVTDINTLARDTSYYVDNSALIVATDAQSAVINKGTINSNDRQDLMMANNGALVENSGTINILPGSGSNPPAGVMRARGEGSRAVNASGGTLNLTTTTTPTASEGMSESPLRWYFGVNYALWASNYGSATNEAGATINIHGAGTYGMAASKGTAANAGKINVDGFIPTLDENGNIISEEFWRADQPFMMGGGILVGSTDSGVGDAQGLNTGTINVNNAGFGMLAMNGGKAVNQGTINLTSDEGVTKQQDNQLFAIGAIKNGIAINDTSGVINIDTTVGQAFYNDGTGTIINYGTICTFDVCQTSDEYNPTDNAISDVYNNGDILSAQGTTRTLSSTIIAGTVTNAGKAQNGTIVIADNGELINESTGTINTAITVSGTGILENSGTVNTVDMKG
ncbi:MAG: hypothetical protein RSA84_11355, partial [Acinetobacter sp.]